tara:strand:- start:4461 stop:4646 length:186 start_codon:yes stop_codon:yes gene_type:complete
LEELWAALTKVRCISHTKQRAVAVANLETSTPLLLKVDIKRSWLFASCLEITIVVCFIKTL